MILNNFTSFRTNISLVSCGGICHFVPKRAIHPSRNRLLTGYPTVTTTVMCAEFANTHLLVFGKVLAVLL